eukprot:TRINITY_DN6290_c0_g2_i3.p1 TRINITY_DN6290_c0_g2~~TRINITY_DN6290_c0_g2_i3.p1  ORF type:complete len:384 (+),score=17.33 TRINITY_DN6290_c0_g2_i3:269-1420(+)
MLVKCCMRTFSLVVLLCQFQKVLVRPLYTQLQIDSYDVRTGMTLQQLQDQTVISEENRTAFSIFDQQGESQATEIEFQMSAGSIFASPMNSLFSEPLNGFPKTSFNSNITYTPVSTTQPTSIPTPSPNNVPNDLTGLGVRNRISPQVSFNSSSQAVVVVDNSYSSGSEDMKQNSNSANVSSQVSVSHREDVLFQTMIDDKLHTLVLVPVPQQRAEPVGYQGVGDIFQQIMFDNQTSNGDQSAFVADLARQAGQGQVQGEGSSFSMCPEQAIAQEKCPFQDGSSNMSSATELYNFLAGTCNHFIFNGYLAHPSTLFSPPHDECCQRLQNMWSDNDQQQTLTYCSCNRNFKCNENFELLGPQQGSDLQDLLVSCGITLDLSTVQC